MIATVPLKHSGIVHGVHLFTDPNDLWYFSFESDSEPISAPDGVNGFAQITIHRKVIVCKLVEKNGFEPYLVYVRKTDGWLTGEHQEKSKDFPEGNHLFALPVVYDDSFLHFTSGLEHFGGNVFSLVSHKWLSVVTGCLGETEFKEHCFSHVEKKKLPGRPALILRVQGLVPLNPYCIYFLDTNTWLEIPVPQSLAEKGFLGAWCHLFCAIADEYCATKYSPAGLSSYNEKTFVWRFDKNEYLVYDDEKSFQTILYTDTHIAMHLKSAPHKNRDYWEILNTKTWLPVAREVRRVTSMFSKAEIKHGKIVATIEAGSMTATEDLPE